MKVKYREVLGEESRSNHKQFLVRRIAWRLQANAEGELSERARQRALALAQENARRNGFEQNSFVRENVFSHLEALEAAGERFGLIILDPPKFARARNAVCRATP